MNIDKASQGTGNYFDWIEYEGYPYSRLIHAEEEWREQELIDKPLCEYVGEMFFFGDWNSLCERWESHGNAANNDTEIQTVAGRECEPD